MGISSGTRVGPYEIIAPLGAGGMGEVYRARDLRLSREVALKTLLPDAASDAGRRQRFEQEGRAVAALNHPNIIGIYDVGTSEDVTYLVSELVDGESLGAILRRGPLPLRKLLDVAVQVADGLAAAHAAGIVHRDLKPDNIMLTRDGRAKILDFGLARQSGFSPAAGDRTATVHMTQPGMILGTVSYMSPEQATGRTVDHRSDQFAFGLILYEMAAGKKAYEKKESVQTLAAIVSEPPPPLDASVPQPLRWIVDRCLAKEPEGRYDSTRDLYQELRNLRDRLSGTSVAAAPAIAPARRKPLRVLPWLAGTLAVALAFIAGALLAPRSGANLGAYRFTPLAVDPEGQRHPVWSPDGKAITYTGSTNGTSQVFVRYLASATAVQLTKMPEGGQPIAWSPDARRIFFLGYHDPIGVWSVAPVGGEPESVLPLAGDALSVVWQAVAVSPDNRAIAALRTASDGMVSVWISSPLGAPPKPYSPAPFATRTVVNTPRLGFSPDNSKILLYINANRGAEEAWILPYPPDPAKPPRRVLQALPTAGGTPMFSWMPDNRRMVISTEPSQDAPLHLSLADTAGQEVLPLTAGSGYEWDPAVSPDGHAIAYIDGNSDYDAVSVSLKDATLHKLVATDRWEMMPAWAANQARLVYVGNRNGPMEIWLRNPDGSDRPLVSAKDFPDDATQFFIAPALSPDGDRVVYVHGGPRDMWLWMSAVSGGLPVRLTNAPKGMEFAAAWSPDGNWCAYVAGHDGGAATLMKVKTTGQASPAQLATAVPWSLPAWSPAGDWIAYRGADGAWNLISPDGKTSRDLGKLNTQGLAFSKDGKTLFGLREEHARVVLFSVDVKSGAAKDIGEVTGGDARPRSDFNPGIRFSLAPGGESFVYSTVRLRSNLWLFEGFDRKPDLLERLGLRHR